VQQLMEMTMAFWGKSDLPRIRLDGSTRTAWGRRFAGRWNDWIPTLVPASDVSPRSQSYSFCKMEELQFLDASEMWSKCGQNGCERDTPAELWVFCLFWLFLKRSPLCVCVHFSSGGPGWLLSFFFRGLCLVYFSTVMWSCGVSCAGCHVHSSNRRTSGNQKEKIETSAFLCTGDAEIFTPTH